MCKNTCCFFCVTGLWVGMIYRGIFWRVCRFVWLTGSRGPDFAALSGDLTGYGRKLKSTSAYAALIASISSNIPGPFRSVRQLALLAETLWCRLAESPSADVSFSPFGGTTVSGNRRHFLVGQGETRTETPRVDDGVSTAE